MDSATPDDVRELGIYIPDVGRVLNSLPFNTIYDDVITDDGLVTTAARRRGGRFHSLAPDQGNALDRFILDLANPVAA